LLAGLVLGGAVAGCGTFSETPAPVVAEAGADGASDASDTSDAGSPLDGGGPPIDASPTCVDLTTGTHGFGAFNESGATSSSDGAGLRLHFPAGSAGSAAAWQRTVDAPQSSIGVRLTFDAVITIPSTNLPTTSWYAGLATLVNGKPASVDMVSSVHMVLGEGGSDNAVVSMETFPNGTANPVEGNTFVGTLKGGATTITATLDVKWSTEAGANVRGQLSPQPEATLDARTLVGVRSPMIGLSLGGAAMGNPDLGILYTKVCYEFH
jgi:hypothetical protein